MRSNINAYWVNNNTRFQQHKANINHVNGREGGTWEGGNVKGCHLGYVFPNRIPRKQIPSTFFSPRLCGKGSILSNYHFETSGHTLSHKIAAKSFVQ